MSQKGFSLIELLAGMAVSSLIMVVVVPVIFQVVLGTSRNNNQAVAISDSSLAVVRIKRDLMMAQSTDLVDGEPTPRSSITLTWTDLTSGEPAEEHSSTYALSGTKLYRTYDGTSVTLVAAHVSSLGFTRNDRVIMVTITSTSPSFPPRSETLPFRVYIRSDTVA